jgi:hypothetical protein
VCTHMLQLSCHLQINFQEMAVLSTRPKGTYNNHGYVSVK